MPKWANVALVQFMGEEVSSITLRAWVGAVLVAGLGISPAASAHNIDIEEQALWWVPLLAPDEADFSWLNPYQIDKFKFDQGNLVRVLGVEDSLAVFSYLTPGDVDVYEFTVLPQDFPPPPAPPFVLVAASALPPACSEYRTAYPVTALVGYGLPAPDEAMDLPFDVPFGMGVVMADNPRVHRHQRAIFDLSAEVEALGNTAWFLPDGLTQDCLLHAPWLCDFSNTIAQPVFVPGTYYIVMWNPSGRPIDYTANIGFSEENFEPNEDLEELVKDNGLVHLPCKDPYPND